MSHEYSVQIHNWITRKTEEVKLKKLSADQENDTDKKEYLSGQLEELLFFRQYLSEQIDLETQTYYT